jgi:hypothetical protein
VPGYQGDTSPYAANAHVRTADSGDPVLAWDSHGRLFAGSESSGDPEGTAKTLGDVWVGTYENPQGENGSTADDGKKFVRSLDVGTGSSAPALLGKFNDKTAADVHQCRTQNPDGSFTRDTCPYEGGLDQNIYGAATP